MISMKKFSLAVLMAVFIALFFFSCTKYSNTYKIKGMANVNVLIPPASIIASELTLGSGSSTYNLDSFMQANTINNVKANSIASVKITSCNLLFSNADNLKNAANFSTCKLKYYTNSDPVTGNLRS